MKLLISIATLLCLSLWLVRASPGGLDVSQCHVCRTDCANYWLKYEQYHCHIGGDYSSHTLPEKETTITTPATSIDETKGDDDEDISSISPDHPDARIKIKSIPSYTKKEAPILCSEYATLDDGSCICNEWYVFSLDGQTCENSISRLAQIDTQDQQAVATQIATHIETILLQEQCELVLTALDTYYTYHSETDKGMLARYLRLILSEKSCV